MECDEPSQQADRHFHCSYFFATSVYAGFSGWQLHVMKQQLDATRQAITSSEINFTRDQAPVIWVEPQRPELIIGSPLIWNVVIVNFGRSTALNVRVCLRVAYGVELDKIQVPTTQECEKTTLISNIVLPQGHRQYSTGIGPYRLDKDDIRIIKSIDNGAYVIGIINYEDVSGHSYESLFCSSRLQNGEIPNCPKYNYIKQTR